jgi:hypothetical protein
MKPRGRVSLFEPDFGELGRAEPQSRRPRRGQLCPGGTQRVNAAARLADHHRQGVIACNVRDNTQRADADLASIILSPSVLH